MTSSASSKVQSEIVNTTEGELVWEAPNGKECRTWYRVYGELKTGVRPLVTLHGGPGVTSDYLVGLSGLAVERSIPVVIYDQVGNGRSTHFPETMGDISFWKEELFLDELKRLLIHLGIYDDYDLFGHSWGGMLGSLHAVRQPGGLKHLIIMSSPCSGGLWMEAQEVLRKKLPQDVQDVLVKCEKEDKTDSKEYQEAVAVFYSRFLCTLNPMPESLQDTMADLEKDPTVYLTMNGPSEFYMTGPIKDFSMLNDAHRISVPTLLINGWNDEAADSCVYPYFRLIPRVRWVQFAKSSHMAHLEEPEKFLQIVGLFLTE